MATPAGLLSLGNYTLDVERRVLAGDFGSVQLSPLSARFLRALADQPGRTVSRTELIEELWSGNFLVGEQALNRLASETRRAAKNAGSGSLIETVQKSGYRLQTSADERGWSPVSTPYNIHWRWGWTLFGAALLIGALAWLMDSATGLIWVAKFAH